MGHLPITCRSTGFDLLAWCRRCGAAACILAAGLWAVPAEARVESEHPDDIPAVSRVKAIFATLPKFEHPCGNLNLHWQSHVAPALRKIGPENLNHARKKWSEFKQQLRQVEKARELAAKATEELLLAALSEFKAVGAWSRITAGGNFSIKYQVWYVALLVRKGAEDRLRDIASDYFKPFTTLGFQLLSPKRQQEILDYFEKRANCLQAARRDSFTDIQRTRVELARVYGSALERGNATYFYSGNLDKVAEINAYMLSTKYQGDYSYLSKESTQVSAIFLKLAQARERRIINDDLMEKLSRDLRKNPWIAPRDPLHGPADTRAVRLKISQLRAKMALIALYTREIALEAGMTRRLDIQTGLAEVGKEALKDLPTWWDEVYSGRAFGAQRSFDADNQQTLDSYVRAGATNLSALAAIGLHFTGSSFSAVISPIMRDTGADLSKIINQYVDLGKLQYNTEAVYKDYKKKLKEQDGRIEVLRNMAGKYTYAKQFGFVKTLRSGSVGPNLRDLLEDPDFIAASGGGIPSILAVLCEDPRDLTAVYLMGAQYEFTGTVNAGIGRLLINRGAFSSPEDLPKRPMNVTDFHVAQKYDLKGFIPIVALYRGFKDWFSNVDENQDAYMLQIDLMQKSLIKLIRELPNYNFELDTMIRRRADLNKVHAALLAHNFVYQTAYKNLRKEIWDRRVLYRTVHGRAKGGGKLTTEGNMAVAALQMMRDRETLNLATMAEMTQIPFYAHTLNYPLAAAHTKAFRKILPARNAAYGIKANPALLAQLDEVSKAFKGQDLRYRSAVVWEGLLQTTIEQVILHQAATLIAGSVLGKISPALQESYLAGQTGSTWLKIKHAFVPWFKLTSTTGVLELMIRDALVDPYKDSWVKYAKSNDLWAVVKAKVGLASSQPASPVDEALSYQRRRFQGAVVDAAFEITKDVTQDVATEVISYKAGQAVNWITRTDVYDDLVNSAEASRTILDARYGILNDRINELAALERKRSRTANEEIKRQDLREELNRELRSPELRQAFDAYRVAAGELERVSQYRDRLRGWVHTLLSWPWAADRLKKAALEQLMARPIGELLRTSEVPEASAVLNTARIVGTVMDMKAVLVTKTHSIDDLERLVPRGDMLGLEGQVLRSELDIEVIRGALKHSFEHARNDGERSRIRAVAKKVDTIRIATVKDLLGGFMTDPRYAGKYGGKLASVVQGGASEGNPEYQGIFGDIDMTAYLDVDLGPAELAKFQGEFKNDLVAYFAEQGYPLALVKTPSTMDTEVFVESLVRFHSPTAGVSDVLVNVAQQHAAPTGFYTEGGSAWARNNYAFSGQVLWGKSDVNPLKWVMLDRSNGYGLMVDMMRYFGKIIDPAYSPGAVGAADTGTRKKALLGEVMAKGKVFLRAIDAYQISDVEGNKHYNDRRNKRGGSGDDASYHNQIYKDAKAMRETETAQANRDGGDRYQTIFDKHDPDGDGGDISDIEVLRWLAEIKMKEKNPDMWSVLGGDDAEQVRNAQIALQRMRTLLPVIIARTAEVWFQSYDKARKSDDPVERQRAFAMLQRMVSTYKAMKDRDRNIPIPLVIPKFVPEPDGTIRILTESEHRDVIRAAMNAALGGENTVRNEINRIERIIEGRPEDDVSGEATRRRADAERERMKADLANGSMSPDGDIPALGERALEQNLLRAWAKMKFSLALEVSGQRR